jgi:hypothetical protein
VRFIRTHSFATGPVMAEPFISPLALTMTPALSYGHWEFAVYDQLDTYLEVQEHTISSTPRLALSDNDSRHCYYETKHFIYVRCGLEHEGNTYSFFSVQAFLSSPKPQTYLQPMHQADDLVEHPFHKVRLRREIWRQSYLHS